MVRVFLAKVIRSKTIFSWPYPGESCIWVGLSHLLWPLVEQEETSSDLITLKKLFQTCRDGRLDNGGGNPNLGMLRNLFFRIPGQKKFLHISQPDFFSQIESSVILSLWSFPMVAFHLNFRMREECSASPVWHNCRELESHWFTTHHGSDCECMFNAGYPWCVQCTV